MEYVLKKILHDCRYYKMMKFYKILKNDPTNETEFISLLNILLTIRLLPCFGYNGYLFYKLMDQIKTLHNDFILFLKIFNSIVKHKYKQFFRSNFVIFLTNVRLFIERSDYKLTHMNHVDEFITHLDELKKKHDESICSANSLTEMSKHNIASKYIKDIEMNCIGVTNNTLLKYYSNYITTLIEFIRFIVIKYNKVVTFIIKCSKDHNFYITKKEKNLLQTKHNVSVFSYLNHLSMFDRVWKSGMLYSFYNFKVLFFDENNRPIKTMNIQKLQMFMNAAEWNRALLELKWLKKHRSLDKISDLECGQTFTINNKKLNTLSITIDESCRVCMVTNKHVMYIVARGTADKTDILTDVHLFIHNYDRMIQKHEFIHFVNKHKDKIMEFLLNDEQNKVIFTGFSLGGALVNYFNINKSLHEFLNPFKSKITVITFNRGESLKTHIYRKEYFTTTRTFEQHDIYCTGDFIPLIVKNEHVSQYKFIYPWKLEAHSILLIIDRLKQFRHQQKKHKNGNVVHDTIEHHTNT